MFWQIFLESAGMILLVLIVGGVVHWLVHGKSDNNEHES